MLRIFNEVDYLVKINNMKWFNKHDVYLNINIYIDKKKMVENKVNCESTNKNDTEQSDWDLPLAFSKPYHTENIEGINCVAQTWRMKEKVF